MARNPLIPGRVYRTRDLKQWSNSPSRLANSLIQKKTLLKIKRGIFFCPTYSRFGVVPPNDKEIIRAFLNDSPFVFTGPDKWNALNLGASSLFAVRLVYNTRYSGLFNFGNQKFLLRRIPFPKSPPLEWFVIDLLNHANQAGLSLVSLCENLKKSQDKFNLQKLMNMNREFGSKLVKKTLTGFGFHM